MTRSRRSSRDFAESSLGRLSLGEPKDTQYSATEAAQPGPLKDPHARFRCAAARFALDWAYWTPARLAPPGA